MTRNRWAPWAAFASLALPPLCLRALSLVEGRAALSASDLRGLAADLAISALLLALLWPLARVARWAVLLVVALLVAGEYANYETIEALGSVASIFDVEFLGNATFVGGSVAAIGHPWLVAGLISGSLGLAFGGFRPLGLRPAGAALAGGLLLLVGVELWPAVERIETWRQVNVLQENLAWLARRETPDLRPSGSASTTAMLDLLPELRSDGSGQPRFAFDGRGKNVLLVVLEGVSGEYLHSAAAFHRRHPGERMDALDGVLRDNLGFVTFIDHNRRTNRGLYTLLCGELPNLIRGTPKMTAAATRPWQKCLPQVLADQGYETVYLQAAPLAFMLKDQFMPRAGFQQVHGHKWFKEYYMRTAWGVDDRAFFEQASQLIGELDHGHRPWFLTLLTVGTHHPYVVPPPYSSVDQHQHVRGAFEYLDRAIGEFVARLEKSGIRDDTLVLITSDESSGFWPGTRDAVAGRLTQNWGFLIALLPERARGLVTEPYAQMDVAFSVLDYLGLAGKGRHFFGRSLFRHYDHGRHLFFGNVNFRTIGGLGPDGTLVFCEWEGDECHSYDAFSGRVFADELAPVPSNPELEKLVVEMAQRSRPPDPKGDLRIDLLADPVFTVDMPEMQLVQGVSQLALGPEDWLEVAIDVKGKGSGRATLEHFLRMPRRRDLLHTTALIGDGQTLHIRYTVASDTPISQMTLRSKAALHDGWKLDLEFSDAHITLHRGGKRPELGVQVQDLSLAPPKGGNDGAPKSRVMDYSQIQAAVSGQSAYSTEEEEED